MHSSRWHYNAVNTDHRSWQICNTWYAASCMTENKVLLWDIKVMTHRLKTCRHTCWSVAIANTQSLDTEEDSAKKAGNCIKYFITDNVL